MNCAFLENVNAAFIFLSFLFQCDKGTIPCSRGNFGLDYCVQMPDGYCGWCNLENRCTRREQCEKADEFLEWATKEDFPNVNFILPGEKQQLSAPQKCEDITNCAQCAFSQTGCDWCLLHNKCTSSAEDCGERDVIVKNIRDKSPGAGACPIMESSDILVPYGSTTKLHVTVYNARVLLRERWYSCILNIDGNQMYIPATVLDEKVTCGLTTFNFTSPREPIKRISLSIVFGDNVNIQTSVGKDVSVVIYQCPGMARSCDECGRLDQKFGCAWCDSSHMCDYEKNVMCESWTRGVDHCHG